MPTHRQARFKPAEVALFALPLVVLVAVLAVFRLRPTFERLAPTAANPKVRKIWKVELSFSPDGKVLATGDSQGFLKWWDSRDGKLLAILRQSGPAINDLKFSPNGKHLAVSLGKSLLIYDVASKQLGRTIVGGKLDYDQLAWSSDSQKIAVATTTGWSYRKSVSIGLWQAQTGKKLAELNGKFTSISGLSFSPDGQSLAVSCGDRRTQDGKITTSNFLQRWNLKTCQITYEQDLNSLESNVLWAPNGQQLILIGEIRNAHTGRTELALRNDKSNEKVRKMALSDDGSILAGANSRRYLVFWDLKKGRTMEWYRAKFKGNFFDDEQGDGAVSEFKMAPDATRIANSGSNGIVYLWEIYRDVEGQIITDPWQLPQPIRLWKLNVETGATEEIPAGIREEFFFQREPAFGSKQRSY